jgi:hypothetical protein
VTAPYDRWVLLGQLLETRRRVLGHTWRTTFERDSGVNARLAAEIEKAAKDRVNHFMPGTLQLVAHGYEVTYESVLAVLRGEADALVPAAPAPTAPAELPDAVGARSPEAQDYADRIWERLLDLADSGITDPPGGQLFPDSPEDARTWDNPKLRRNWTVRARVRMIADLQYLDTRPGRREQDNAG